jgi:hypothetical protein
MPADRSGSAWQAGIYGPARQAGGRTQTMSVTLAQRASIGSTEATSGQATSVSSDDARYYRGSKVVLQEQFVMAGVEPTSGVSGVARAVTPAATAAVTVPALSPAAEIGPVRSHPNTGQ